MGKEGKIGFPMFRDQEYEILVRFLNSSFCPPFIHCSGPPSTGKALTVQNALSDLEIPYAWENCIEACNNPRALYEDILKAFQRFGLSKQSKQYYQKPKCENGSVFVEKLAEIISERKWSDKTVCIVLKGSERLRSQPNLLKLFSRLSQFVKSRICVISISRVALFRPCSDLMWRIDFENYTQSINETVELLQEFTPDNFYKQNTIDQYCGLIVPLLFPLTRNLSQIKHIKSWPEFMAPVEKGECVESNIRYLYSNFRSNFKVSEIRPFYHRRKFSECDTADESLMETSDSSDIPTALTKLRPADSPSKEIGESLKNLQLDKASDSSLPEKSFNMSRRLKFLLVACYAASYNPQSSDKRFFCKAGKNPRRHTQQTAKQEKKSAHLLGPKMFNLERLVCIFRFITESENFYSINLLPQISTLVSTGCVAQASASGNLEAPKFRCLASLELVRAIARTVDFDLMAHLYDFTNM